MNRSLSQIIKRSSLFHCLLPILLLWSPVFAKLGDVKMEGVWGGYKEPTAQGMLKYVTAAFLPYNPVAIEIGGGAR